jgi:hypothetical protein
MNQPRSLAISLRDFLMLIVGVLLTLLLHRTSTELRAAGFGEPGLAGLACGDWIMQTDQQRPAGDFDAFILNVKTGELLRTRNAGKEMLPVVKK